MKPRALLLALAVERDELQRAADDASMSCSTWIRAVALERARALEKAKQEDHG